MNYGFAIDTRRCIGCHACSTACKSENQVPLGVNRTWVKYTESGRFPDTRRSFQVTRCNHCANPPCVRICPVAAMVQRDDGIVEFSGDACIGCKACLQACPYDAIYIDPDSGTAAKCHFCAHRVETGLEPACVVVCPTHAILAGDLDDPVSEISRFIAGNDVSVRKPEQGTAPKLFYAGGTDTAMHPTATERVPDGFAFADVVDPHDGSRVHPAYADQAVYEVSLRFGDEPKPAPEGAVSSWGAEIRTPGDQGDPAGGPIQVAPGRMAEQMVQVAYTAHHKVPWHWQVPAYLVTKSLGTGVFLLLASALVSGRVAVGDLEILVGGGLGLVALLATTALLVGDLERPERFLRILLQPQWKSWLTRGAFLLVAASNVVALWWALSLGAWLGVGPGGTATLGWGLAALSIPLSIGAAVYTAYLFAQCEGRDLWQSPLLPAHLLVQSVTMGGAGLLLIAPFISLSPGLVALASLALGGGLVLDAFLVLAGELGVPHASEVAARAAHAITRGAWRKHFWLGGIALGHVLPLALLVIGGPVLGALAAVAAIAGLYFYETAFVMAPQEIPNS